MGRSYRGNASAMLKDLRQVRSVVQAAMNHYAGQQGEKLAQREAGEAGAYSRQKLRNMAELRHDFGKLKPAEQQRVLAEAKRQLDAVKEVRNADGKLLAPNGEVSNLNELQWKQVRTPWFKEWFGASKVLDANGEPRAMYHRTRSDFTVFDTTDKNMDFTIPNNRGDNIGAFFSSSPKNTSRFGDK